MCFRRARAFQRQFLMEPAFPVSNFQFWLNLDHCGNDYRNQTNQVINHACLLPMYLISGIGQDSPFLLDPRPLGGNLILKAIYVACAAQVFVAGFSRPDGQESRSNKWTSWGCYRFARLRCELVLFCAECVMAGVFYPGQCSQ